MKRTFGEKALQGVVELLRRRWLEAQINRLQPHRQAFLHNRLHSAQSIFHCQVDISQRDTLHRPVCRYVGNALYMQHVFTELIHQPKVQAPMLFMAAGSIAGWAPRWHATGPPGAGSGGAEAPAGARWWPSPAGARSHAPVQQCRARSARLIPTANGQPVRQQYWATAGTPPGRSG
jgi:hypothetical protein